MAKKLLLAMILIPAFLASAMGAEAAGDHAAVREMLKGMIPGADPDSIRPTPVSGLLEVMYGPQVFYVTSDAKYILQGNLLDVGRKANLTESRRADARLAALGKVAEDQMIIFSPKEYKHTITVFTDIDCGYCRKLHSEREQYEKEGIRIRYMAYPRAGLNSESYQKAVSVWCAKDRGKALTEAKLGHPVEEKKCDNPVKEEFELGEALGVSGTPTIVTDNGELLPGYVPAQRLAQMLDAHSAAN